jgi:hypothetical protein
MAGPSVTNLSFQVLPYFVDVVYWVYTAMFRSSREILEPKFMTCFVLRAKQHTFMRANTPTDHPLASDYMPQSPIGMYIQQRGSRVFT